jgi:hypothetical protein
MFMAERRNRDCRGSGCRAELRATSFLRPGRRGGRLQHAMYYISLLRSKR